MKKKSIPNLHIPHLIQERKTSQSAQSYSYAKRFNCQAISTLDSQRMSQYDHKKVNQTKKMIAKLMQENNKLKQMNTKQQKEISILKIHLDAKDLQIKNLKNQSQIYQIQTNYCKNAKNLELNRLSNSQPKKNYHRSLNQYTLFQEPFKQTQNNQKESSQRMPEKQYLGFQSLNQYQLIDFSFMPTEGYEITKKQNKNNRENIDNSFLRRREHRQGKNNGDKKSKKFFGGFQAELQEIVPHQKSLTKTRIQKIISEYRVEKSLQCMHSNNPEKSS